MGKLYMKNQRNTFSRKQKKIGKFIAKRQGKNAGEVLQDYTLQQEIVLPATAKG